MSWIEIALKNFPSRCGGHKGEHPIHPPTPVTLVGSLRVCITLGWVLWCIPLIQEGGFGLSTRRGISLYTYLRFMYLWVWKWQNVIILIVILCNIWNLCLLFRCLIPEGFHWVPICFILESFPAPQLSALRPRHGLYSSALLARRPGDNGGDGSSHAMWVAHPTSIQEFGNHPTGFTGKYTCSKIPHYAGKGGAIKLYRLKVS